MQHIAICGTVGSGKTTLLRRLCAQLGARAASHEERPQDNPYMTDYYADSRRWSFHSQMTFLSLYFDERTHPAPARDAQFYLYDRCFLENLVLARYRLNQGDLTQDEYDVIVRLARGVASLLPPIDKYIYLDCSVSTILEHMRGRGREYEDDLDLMFIVDLKKLYDEWLETLPKDKTLTVNMDHDAYDLEEILKFIEA